MIYTLGSTALPAFRTATVPAPEFGEDVEFKIRELSGKNQAELQKRLKNDAAMTDEAITAYILYASVVDENDKALFGSEDQAAAFLDAIPAKALNRLNKAIWDLNNSEPEKNS